MSISCDSFQKFTDWLQEQDSCDEEIKYRSCVNRAYYCIFHFTKESLLEKMLIMNPRANHHEVIEKLKLEDELLGNKLYYFFDERKNADYNLGADLSKKKAIRLVQKMKNFPNELKESDEMIKSY